MACTVKINGKEMSEAEFYAWLIDGGLNNLVDTGKVDLKAVGQMQSKSQATDLKAGVENLEESLLAKHKGLKTLFLSESKGVLSVDMIEVASNERGKGVGSSVMNDIIKYADANNMEIRLNPAVKDDNIGTTSRNRLVKFYKSLGFIENKGRNIDFAKKAGTMYRLPESQAAESAAQEYSSKSQSDFLGIASNIWNTSINKVAAAMKADKTLEEALDEGVDYIKSTHGPFDEQSYRKGFEKRYARFKANRPVSVKRVRGHFDTISSNPDLKNAVATLNKVDFIYDTKTQDQTTKEAEAYIAEVGVEQAYLNFIDNKFPASVTEDVKVAISSLLVTMMDGGIAKAVENNDQETADEIWRDMERLSKVTSEMGTAAGRAVNAYKRFTIDFYNPVTAVFYAMKMSEAANNKVREKGVNKRSSKRIANDVKGKVNTGKKSVASDVAKSLPKNEIKGLIEKGVDSKTSDAVKGKISSFFDGLKESFGNINLSEITKTSSVKSKSQAVNAAIRFVEKVKEKFLKGGVTLSQAMLETSAEMIKDGSLTPPQALELRKKMSGAVNQSKPRVQTEQAKALKEATEEFNAKEELKKALEKDKERRAALKAKEAEAQSKRIETQAAKLEAAKTAEEIRQADRRIKEKEELERELEKERQRIADLRAAEEQAIKDKVAKRELERAKAAVEQAKKDQKALESKVKELTSDVLKSNEEIIEQIIDEYLDLQGGAQTNNAILIDMVKDKLGLDDVQAKKVATQIANGVNKKIKEKLINKYGGMLTEEERQVKKAGRKPPVDPLTELIRASKLGVLEAEQAVMTLFQNKYGITSFNQQDAAKVKEISGKIAEAQTPERRNKAIAEMANYLASKNPVSFSDLMNELWYFKTLSSVLTIVYGTADVNNKYNIAQLATNAVEMPVTSLLSSMRMREGQTIGQVIQNGIDGMLYGYAKALFQQLQTNKSEKDGLDNFANIIWQSKGNFLSESITYLREVLANGQAGLQEIEKPFEAKSVTDFDIKRWFEQSRAGDEFAKKKIAKLMFALINTSMRGVPRVLAGSDAFFGGIVKNAYIPVLLMEKYYKEGLRGAALNQKVLQELVVSKEATEEAINNAVNSRMSNDITFEKRGSFWVILDRGKLQKGVFNSLDEAKDYAKDNIANSGLQYKKDLIFFLNKNIGNETISAANRVAQRDLLSGPTEGLANYIYIHPIKFIVDKSREASNFLNAAAKAQGGPEWKAVVKMFGTGDLKDGGVAVTRKMISIALKAFAIVVKSFSNLVAYSRVALNLGRKSSNYILPIGLIRYGMARSYNRSLVGFKYKDNLTAVEQEKIMAQAIVGTVYLLMFTSAVAGTKELINKMLGDEDDDESKGSIVAKNIAKRYKEDTGEEMPDHVFEYLSNLKPGDVIGSMAFLDDLVGGKGRRAYYNKTGIIKENSIFKGIDSNGNYIYEPLIGTPEASFALALGTYLTYHSLVSNEEKSLLGPYGWTVYQPLSTFFDMSIGQGIGKFAAGDKSITEKGDALLQSLLLDNFEVFNPDIIKKPLQYWDQKQRVTRRLSDYMKEAPNWKEGVSNYLINSCIPVYGAVYSATKAPQVYGMFGEELYKLPSQEQGLISNLWAQYLKSDKNLEQKNMYAWLGANGYEKIWSAPKEQPIVDQNKNAKILSSEKRTSYGREAGKKSFEDIKRLQTILQYIREIEGEEAFVNEIDNLFSDNFEDAYSIGEGIKTKQEADRYLPVKQEKFQDKLEAKTQSAEDLKFLQENNPLTAEEEAQVKLIKAQKQRYKYIVALDLMRKVKPNEVSDKLDKFVEYKVISQEDADKILVLMGLETPL
jgi:GNAT superfamily N-acetyltransferase